MQGERQEEDPRQGFTPGMCQNQVLSLHRGAGGGTGHRCPLGPPALPAGMGTRRLKAQEKREALGLGLIPLHGGGSRRRDAETRNTRGVAVGISRALPRIFPLWRDLMRARKEHGSLMSSKAQERRPLPTELHTQDLSRQESCSQGAPRDGQSQLSFPKPSGEQERAGG